MDGLEADWGDSVQVVRLNVQDDGIDALLDELDFRFTPTFILLDTAGQEQWRTFASLAPDVAKQQVQLLDEKNQ